MLDRTGCNGQFWRLFSSGMSQIGYLRLMKQTGKTGLNNVYEGLLYDLNQKGLLSFFRLEIAVAEDVSRGFLNHSISFTSNRFPIVSLGGSTVYSISALVSTLKSGKTHNHSWLWWYWYTGRQLGIKTWLISSHLLWDQVQAGSTGMDFWAASADIMQTSNDLLRSFSILMVVEDRSARSSEGDLLWISALWIHLTCLLSTADNFRHWTWIALWTCVRVSSLLKQSWVSEIFNFYTCTNLDQRFRQNIRSQIDVKHSRKEFPRT